MSIAHAEYVLPSAYTIPWSPGVPGGIPHFESVTCTGVVGDGETDDTTAIQSCINALSPDQAAYLPPGTYRTTATLSFGSGGDRKVLRGAGPANTTIKCDHNNNCIGSVINGESSLQAISPAPIKGDTTITIANATDYSAGNMVVIYQTPYPYGAASGTSNTVMTGPTGLTVDAWIGFWVRNSTDLSECEITDNDATTLTCAGGLQGGTDNTWTSGDAFVIYDKDLNNPYDPEERYQSWTSPGALAQIARVQSKNGNALTLDRPIYATYQSGKSPMIGKYWNNHYRIGVEDLKIYKPTNTTGSSDIISFRVCQESWIKNVETQRCLKKHVLLEESVACEIRDSYFHDAEEFTSGSGYGIHMLGANSDHLIENNIFRYLRHSVNTEGSVSGVVVAYNYSDWMFGDDNYFQDYLAYDLHNHGTNSFHNLWEGNTGVQLGADFTLGDSKRWVWFRNWSRGNRGVVSPTDGGSSEYLHHQSTSTNASPSNTVLYNTGVTFSSSMGSATEKIYNLTDGSSCTYSSRQSDNQITCSGLTGGSDNTFTAGDTYIIGTKVIYGLLAFFIQAGNLGHALVGNVVAFQGYTGSEIVEGSGSYVGWATDTRVAATSIRHGNRLMKSGITEWEGGEDQALPTSLYLSSKPSWWYGQVPFPPIGPDVSGYVSPLTAQLRYEGIPDAGGGDNRKFGGSLKFSGAGGLH